MNKKVAVRLFYEPTFYESPGGCCGGGGVGGGRGCIPNQDVSVFEGLAERLAERFGLDNLQFEAYSWIDEKEFPFLTKAETPAVSVGEKVVSSGKLPLFSDLETEVEKQLKVD